MKTHLTIYLLLLFLLNTSYGQESSDLRYEPNYSVEDPQFASTTVVKVSDELGSIRDITETKAYILSKNKEEVWIYNLADGATTKTKISGDGPNKIGEIHNIYSFGDDHFIAHDIRGVYKFNADGKLSQQCPDLFRQVNVGVIASGYEAGQYEVIVPGLNPALPMTIPDYYNQDGIFFVARVNLKTCQVQTFGDLPSNSSYTNHNLPVRQRAYVEKLDDDHLLQFFQFDKTIQLLDINNLSQKKSISLSPSKFGELQSAKDRSLQEMTRIAQVNPAYIRMKVTDDGRYLLTQYSQGNEEFHQTQSFLDGLHESPKRWFEVYDLEKGEKLGNDFDGLPNDAILVSAPSLNDIFLYTTEYEGSEGTFLIRTSIELKQAE